MTNIVSSDPVVINVNLVSSTRKGLDLLRRVETFAQELRAVGLEVDVEGYLTVKIHAAPPPATTAKPARPVGPEG